MPRRRLIARRGGPASVLNSSSLRERLRRCVGRCWLAAALRGGGEGICSCAVNSAAAMSLRGVGEQLQGSDLSRLPQTERELAQGCM